MKKNEFLEKMRKDLGYSRKKIAEYLEVSPTTIERYEKGKLDFTHKTKYILGICALSGFNNEIFLFDEIDNESLIDYKITKFSKKLRKILYFLNIEYDDYESYIAKMFYKGLPLEEYDFDLFKIWDIKDNLLNQNFYKQKSLIEYIKVPKEKLEIFYNGLDEKFKSKYSKETIIKDVEKSYEIDKIEFFTSLGFEILLLFIFDFFNIKEFYEEYKFQFFIKILQSEEAFINSFKKVAPVGVLPLFSFEEDYKKLKQLYPTIKKTIEELEKTGKPVTKETIKEFKLELETGGIIASCPEITDPKDKQICELLQYAPPAFKDKIIEKLLQYKKDVEEF